MADPPVAFVSWAHGSQQWERTLAAFAFQLRAFDIDADIDLFHVDSPDVDWSRYGPRAIRESEFVLIAVSAAYRERWDGTNDPSQGAGAAREADALKGLFDKDQKAFRHKVKVVLLPGSQRDDIPDELRASVRVFEISSFDREGLAELMHTLTGQPRWRKPPLGGVAVLPDALPDEDGIKDRLAEVRQEIDDAPGDTVPENLSQRRSVMEAALDAAQTAERAEPAEPATGGEIAGWIVDWLSYPPVALSALATLTALVHAVVEGRLLAALPMLIVLGVIVVLAIVDPPDPQRFLGVPVALAAVAVGLEWFGAGLVLSLIAAAAAGVAVSMEWPGAWLIVLGIGAIAIIGNLGDDEPTQTAGRERSTPTATLTPAPAAEPTVTVAGEEPVPDAEAVACTEPPVEGAERETAGDGPSNQTRDAADGPLQGGSGIGGATGTRNDRDWLYFCAAGGPTTIRFLVPDDADDDCSDLEAELQGIGGRAILESPLRTDPGGAVTARETLESGALYRVKISHPYGGLCRWRLGVGPPGALFGDPEPPATTSCLPSGEASEGRPRNGFEPNERIDQVALVSEESFAVDGQTLVVEGRISSASDQEWFAFCSPDERMAVTVRLNRLDYSDDVFDSPCSDVELALLDGNGTFQDNADPIEVRPGVDDIAWTTDPSARYYIWISQQGSGACRWRLRVAPREAITSELPVADWNG